MNGSSGSGSGPGLSFKQNGSTVGYMGTTGYAVGGSGTDLYLGTFSGDNLFLYSGGSQAAKFDTSQNATFAGKVTAGTASAGVSSFYTNGSAQTISNGANHVFTLGSSASISSQGIVVITDQSTGAGVVFLLAGQTLVSIAQVAAEFTSGSSPSSGKTGYTTSASYPSTITLYNNTGSSSTYQITYIGS